MTELEGEGFRVHYFEDVGRVELNGVMRLGGIGEYAPVTEILNKALDENPSWELDLSQLRFLNSSGIATLSKFIIRVRAAGDRSLKLIGSEQVPWQMKSLQNLKRLMPTLELRFQSGTS